jgi:serine/threonine protein kinase
MKFGDYYLFERVAVGGMAEVYKGVSYGVEGFERLFAVKRVLPDISEDQEFIEMFIDEAKIAVQLTHANIGQIFELGNAEGSYFIAMEFVQGKDGRAIFDRARSRAEHLSIPMVCHIIKEVCEALEYAHNKRNDRGESLDLIHRDVSPQNVLVSYDGEVKLIDFGIAKAAGKASKTQAGILKGKFSYMSPEQVRGKPIDKRSDLFSLGVCLYELLTLERCFSGESDFSTLEKVREADFRRPTQINRDIPPELEKIVYRALARDPDQRFQNASDFQDALQKFLYQSGAFYSRKDLAAFMRATFAKELESEQQRLAAFRDHARRHIAEARRPDEAPPEPIDAIPHFEEVELYEEPDVPEAAWSEPGDDDDPETEVYNREPGQPPPDMLPFFNRGGQAPVAQSARSAPPARGTLPQGSPSDRSRPPGPGWVTGGLPAVSGGHPAISGGHPAVSGGHPAITGGHPAATGGHPAVTGGHRPGYGLINTHAPATTGGWPRASGMNAEVSGGYALGGQHGITSPPSGSPPAYGPDTMPGDISPGPGFHPGYDGRSSGRRIGLILLVALLSVGLGVAAVLLLANGAELASLEIETTPLKVEIYLDGRLMHEESTPITVNNLKPGEHTIKVVAEDHEALQSTVFLNPGEKRRLSFELDRLVAATLLAIKSEPSGAQVFIDGKLVDQTPLNTEAVAPGERQLELKKDGYQPWTGRIRVQQGRENIVPPVRLYPATVAVTFVPEPADAEATLAVRLGDGTEKALDGRRIEGLLNDGRATVVVAAKGYERLERTLPKYRELTVTEVLTLEKSPERAPPPRRPATPERRPEPREEAPPPREEVPQEDGFLKLLAKPPARASVRGRDLGWTPVLKHALPPGTYTVELVRDEEPAYRASLQVQIKPGETTFERYTHP